MKGLNFFDYVNGLQSSIFPIFDSFRSLLLPGALFYFFLNLNFPPNFKILIVKIFNVNWSNSMNEPILRKLFTKTNF